MPDEQAVPRVFTIIATPVVAIIFGIQYKFYEKSLTPEPIVWTTSLFLVFALIGLFLTSYIIKRFGISVTIRTKYLKREVECVRIGGSELNPEAKGLQKLNNKTNGQLLQEAGYDVYLVFTRRSVANIHLAVQVSYLMFEISGPLALCGVGLLLSNLS